MPRTTFLAAATLAGVLALSALPTLAAGDAAKPAVAADNEKLSQALSHLSASDGFELRGLDKIGDETIQAPKSGPTVKTLRKLLTGYAYTVEFAPADPAGKAPRKLSRVSILGRSSETATGETAPPPAAGTAAAVEASAAAPGDSAQPSHPVTRMLQSLAKATMPSLAQPGNQTNQNNETVVQGAGVPAAVPAASAGGSVTPATSSPSAASPGAASTGNAAGQPDMAALTQQASAGLNALVQSLKAACPAGSKC